MPDKETRPFSPRTPALVVTLEAAGFLVAVAACWLTEWFDPPFNLRQAIALSAVILALGTATTWWTLRAFRRIRFLEGFFVICSGCKRVRVGEEWVPIERFLGPTRALSVSHGICPHCAEKYFGPRYGPGHPPEH